MAQKNLVTAGETANTVSGLGALADNLNEHVNDSMAKAHGWTLVNASFKDSGGCFHTSPILGIYHTVVRIVIGSKVFYVPAQLSGGLDGHSDAIIPATTGIISPQAADPSQDLTVGSPTPAALTTAFADALNTVSDNSSNLLFSHAGSPPEQAHGGLSFNTEKTFDNAAHLVGHFSINLLIGGVAYKLIANDNILGVTQAPLISTACPQVTATFVQGADFSQQSACGWLDRNPGGWVTASSYVLSLTVSGTASMTYHWQYALNPAGPWTDITSNTSYAGNAGFSFAVYSTTLHAGNEWVVQPAFGTLSSTPATVKIAIVNSGSHNNATNVAYAIRCIFNNSFIPDGALVASGVFTMAMQDQP